MRAQELESVYACERGFVCVWAQVESVLMCCTERVENDKIEQCNEERKREYRDMKTTKWALCKAPLSSCTALP